MPRTKTFQLLSATLHRLSIAILAMTMAWLVPTEAHGQEIEGADRDDFVTASLLVVSPTTAVYSVFGHVAFRMECPSKGLDYVFSYESDSSVSGFLTFFAGNARAAFVAVPTAQFVSDMKQDGRGITQYPLNLTPYEKQELWRTLDNDMVAGATRHFNLLLSNCVSTAIVKLHEALLEGNERLEWGPWQDEMLLNNGDLVRHNTHRSPWAEWLFVTFLGTGYSDFYDQETRLCPENIIKTLSHAHIVDVNSSKQRPALRGDQKELLPTPASANEPASAPSPTVIFGGLLLLAIAITVAQQYLGWRRLAEGFDIALFGMQTLAGFVLLYITCFSQIFGLLWNWYLLPTLPIPLVLWLIGRRRPAAPWLSRLWLGYAVLLLAFVALTPIIPQLDWEHQLITLTLAVRAWQRSFIKGQQTHCCFSMI